MSNRQQSTATDRPASKGQAAYKSDLPLAEKLVETPLAMVEDIFDGALDRRDATANSRLIKDAIGCMKNGDIIAAHEAKMRRLRTEGPVPETPREAHIRALKAELACLEADDGNERRAPPKG